MNSTSPALDFCHIMTLLNVSKGRHDLVETKDEPEQKQSAWSPKSHKWSKHCDKSYR